MSRPERGAGASAGYTSGARVLSIGIASTGIFTFLYLAFASHVLGRAAYARISLCWAIMFVILSVIYRPIEQLLSRTIADRRARGLRGHPLRVPAAIQLGFALCSWLSRWRCATRSSTASSTGRRRSIGSLWWACWPTRPATSRAGGWPATSGSRCTAGWCSWSRRRGSCSRWPWPSASAPARGGRPGDGRGAVCVADRDPISLLADSRRRGGERPGARRGRRGARPRSARVGGARPDVPRRKRICRRRGRDHGGRADAPERRRADHRGQQRRLDYVRPHRLRVQRATDSAGSAPALPGDPDGDPAPPGGTRGAGERPGVPPRDPDDGPDDRRRLPAPWRWDYWPSGPP